VKLKLGDVLFLEGKPEEISPATLQPNLEFLPLENTREQELESQRVILVEAILAPRSTLIGQTLRSAHFREKYDLNVIAIWRSGRPIRTNLSDLPLQFGDALLVQGRHE
jgi:Trk K+ transport system NAD-binding subunit